MSPPYIPLELVLNIITCSLPLKPAILPASHPTTKSLLAWTLVCHETHRLASRYLHTYCIYLDSPNRLQRYVSSASDPHNIPALFLSPFINTIYNLPTCNSVRDLLACLSATLRRLIIDIPLRSIYPEDDFLGVRVVLRAGFEQLVNLEEFVSTRDELYLETTNSGRHPAVWASWRKLRRLSLYNVDITTEFFRDLACLKELETVVLSRSDGNEESLDEWADYFKHTDRSIKLLMLGSERRRLIPDNLLAGRIKNRAEVRIVRMITSVWLQHTIDFEIEECQDYVREHAENGTLWDLDEETIPCNAKPYVDEPCLGQLGEGWLVLDERKRAWSVD